MILIIEDDEATLYALAHRLSYRGYLPLSTTTGEEALEVLSQPATPRAIVLDWRLRGMDGPEVLRRIRADRRLAEVPVLIYSAYLDDDVNRFAMAKGATECIPKGIRGDSDVLLTTLARYVPQLRPERT